ncbi:aldo/keto reductase [Paenibacillus mendelii]|nr:aldo/keto reductase [Paenibacillus mendelii]
MKRLTVEGVPQGVSQLVQGSMMLHKDRMDDVRELLDAYVQAGGNTIDSGHIYGAASAMAIGAWMEERGNRSDMVLIGKGAHPYEQSRMRKTCIENDLLESLERMKTDYVDIYMLHRDDPNVNVAYILDGLNDQLAKGRCRSLGASNWSVARIREANAYAAKHGLTGFACSSPNLSLAKPNEPRWAGCVSMSAEDEAWHQETQLPVIAWSSQSGGFFTGRYSPEKTDDADMVRVYYNDSNWERLRRTRVLAERYGVTANQIALAYVLNQSFPVAAIIGPHKVEELADSVKGQQVELSVSELAWLNLASDALGANS